LGFLIIFDKKLRDMEKFSMNQVIKDKFGESEKNVKTAKSTKRANNKVDGKYVVKIVDGVKYMVLK
jgi:predicted small secreted protein